MKLNTLNTVEAQAYADAFMKANPSEAVTKRFDDCPNCAFARVEDVQEWFTLSSASLQDEAISREAVTGWFQDDDVDGDCADEDGDFCSTPCYSTGDEMEEITDHLSHCSRAGLLLVDAAFFACHPAGL
jgi:hypothetical protein